MSQSGSQSVSSLPTVPTQFTTDSGVAIPAAHNINVFGGAGAHTTGSGSTITVAVTGMGFTWTPVTSANNTVTMAPEVGYIANGGVSVAFVLPVTAAVGDSYRIVGNGNLFSIAQNAGQTITLGFNTTTVGTGTVTATGTSDTLEILCVTANLAFKIINCTGNPSIT